MSSMAGSARSLLVILVGCTVGALSAVVAARASRAHNDNLASRPGQHCDDARGGPSRGRGSPEGDGRLLKVRPAAIATWLFGEIAVDAAKDMLEDGAAALDALEAGVIRDT